MVQSSRSTVSEFYVLREVVWGNWCRECVVVIKNRVDMRLEDDNVVVLSVNTSRSGWFNDYQPEADSEPLAGLIIDDGEEWRWLGASFT